MYFVPSNCNRYNLIVNSTISDRNLYDMNGTFYNEIVNNEFVSKFFGACDIVYQRLVTRQNDQ